MILAGKKITDNGTALVKVTLDYLYGRIKCPKPEVLSKIRQLRIVRSLDPKQCAMLKRALPFFVCGSFNPPYRKTENFAYTEYFIIDLDNISSDGTDIATLKDKIIKDERVVLCFISPGENGIKVMFKLKERCYDAGLYSLFYKLFVKQYCADYRLEQYLDTKTSDVTRACFISFDEDAYYNQCAEAVDLNAYLDISDARAMFDLKSMVENEEKQKEALVPETPADPDPDSETIKNIKQLLNPRLKKREERQVFVPEILNDIADDLKKYVEQTGMVVSSIDNIQYGKKLHFKTGLREAEVNLFYGRRGFTVVQTTKSGTDAELNSLSAELVRTFIDTYQ